MKNPKEMPNDNIETSLRKKKRISSPDISPIETNLHPIDSTESQEKILKNLNELNFRKSNSPCLLRKRI